MPKNLKDYIKEDSLKTETLQSAFEVVAKKVADDFIVEAKQEVHDTLDTIVEDVTSKVDKVLEEADSHVKSLKPIKGDSGKDGVSIKGEKGDRGPKGDSPSEKEIVSLIKPLIPKPIKGDKGEPGKDGKDFDSDKIRKEFNSRIGNLGHGGNANRNIAIGGNSSVLSRYTDLNIKAGSNVTLSYSNNNNTKYLDLTIAASGGGGGGTVRSISTTTVSSTVGAVSATDYVVLANGGVAITLPDATSNTNLYTIKNVGTSSVLVKTTSAQTIDGQTTIIMPVQYTSIDLISDSANWEIT